ncbi:uncharacterized protein LOC124297839 [Neodiprion virginianus]|uniref:uncharacterized protein LOC124297839 n=1 Tax=Neodiprion virginianus TaxID=2961670 RepID=UPI001EE76435|nr:uncharacterized protein LOC124297839 [Neodiprion virginianus]
MFIKASDAASYLEEAATICSWGACVKRFFIVFFIISCLVLYFVPGSRSYAGRGCYIMIDIVASCLKAAVSGSFGYEARFGAYPSSYSSNRLVSFPEIQHTIATNGDVHAEQYNGSAHASRRRRKVKQDLKSEDEKTRGHDRRRHRHEKNSQPLGQSTQRHQLQPVTRSVLKEAEIESTFPPPLKINADRTSNGFYHPGDRKADPSSAYATQGPQYSTSFVISGVKTGPSDIVQMEPQFKQESVDTMEEEQCPQTVNKQRGIPSGWSRPENTLYPENEGPTRDCDIFGLGELDSKWNCDGESKAGFGTMTLGYPEREFDACDLQRHRMGHENVSTNVQDCKDTVEDWEDDARSRISNRRSRLSL